MKRNYLILMAIVFVLGIAFAGCMKNTPETLTPKITNDKVEVTATIATFTWKVKWLGKRISMVELSEHEDMSDSKFYGIEEELEKEDFSVTANDLKPNTKYYYRYLVWNRNYVDNKFGFEVKNFSTQTELPKVKTLEVKDITRTSATGQGEIRSDGGLEITERGICWSTNHNPTTSDSHAASSQNTMTFSVPMTDLTPEETYYVRAYAKNAKGTAYSENEMWFVTGDAVPPTVTTAQVTDISWRTATGGGEVTEDGDAIVTERGLCWSTNENPTIEDIYIESGSGTGLFTGDIAGLTAGTTYHVRAYAKNRAGYGYGNDVSFNTIDAVVPMVTTSNPTDITRTSAICGGEVTSDGGSDITERGVCWCIDSNLSISGNHLAAAENGVGSFTVQITGLTPNTSYYVCSYATNSVGTSYGMPKSFATLPISKPTVVTIQMSNITQTTVSSGGNVTDDGGAGVNERGICWGFEHDITLETSLGHVNSGIGCGEFTLNINNLTPNSLYFIRAYATNSEGTSYGNELSFVTLANVTTSQIIDIHSNTAVGGGFVDEGGNASIIDKGICWSTSHNPTMNGNHSSNGSGTGGFTINMTGLSPSTTYYVCAYAENSSGTVYGNEVIFTTVDHDYVDLALPSGLLWATCNIGANAPQSKGYYFAWGETQSKNSYSWETYQYGSGHYNITKYCTKAGYGYNGFTDNLITLLPEDDAATANWGHDWRMPTKEEWEELFQNTTQIWTTYKGVNGMLFTASNGNTLFLPAAGCKFGSSLLGADKGYYFTSSLNSDIPYNAWNSYITSSDSGIGDRTERYAGLSVRAVRSALLNNK